MPAKSSSRSLTRALPGVVEEATTCRAALSMLSSAVPRQGTCAFCAAPRFVRQAQYAEHTGAVSCPPDYCREGGSQMHEFWILVSACTPN